MSVSDDFSGLAVGRAVASTITLERVRIAASLRALREAVGYRGAKAAIDAEWARAVANDPRRAEDEGFVG